MSANFTGVTFPNQKVTPANDAVIRRAIFDDGILTGCDLSYSGSTLTMTAGQLMICGRQIIHPSSPELGSNRGDLRVCPAGADDRRHPYQHEGHL